MNTHHVIDDTDHQHCTTCKLCVTCGDCDMFGCTVEKFHQQWLQKRIELVFGKRCEEKEKDCVLCEVWETYDYLIAGEQHE